MKTGYVYHPIYLKHDTGTHPENIRRLEVIMSHLEETGMQERLIPVAARPATVAELGLVHSPEHIAEVTDMAQSGGGWLDPDTVMSADSYQAALYAAGGTIAATEAVMQGEVDNAFALVRPPGHHAMPGRAMGFCLFNNIAIAVKYALEKFKLERVLIVDFDVHHGNGTQAAFYDNPQVLYISTHLHPFYPGTGRIDEVGNGNGRGFNINIPLPAGCGDAEYELVFSQIVVPASRRFRPQLILVSAGYDTHWSDQLAMMEVSVAGFVQMVRHIKGLADEFCGGRMAFTLEGGYNMPALAASVKATFQGMLGDEDIPDPLGGSKQRTAAPDILPELLAVKQTHQLP